MKQRILRKGIHSSSSSTYLPQIANDPANELHLCGSWEVVIGELDTFGKWKAVQERMQLELTWQRFFVRSQYIFGNIKVTQVTSIRWNAWLRTP